MKYIRGGSMVALGLFLIGCVQTDLRYAEEVQIKNIQLAAEEYYFVHNQYPQSFAILTEANPDLNNLDVWQNELRIEFSEDFISIQSAGPDGLFSTDDDVVSADKNKAPSTVN